MAEVARNVAVLWASAEAAEEGMKVVEMEEAAGGRARQSTHQYDAHGHAGAVAVVVCHHVV